MEEKPKKQKVKNKTKSKRLMLISILVIVIIVGVILYITNNTTERVVGENTKEFVEAVAENEYYLKLAVLDSNLNPTQNYIEISRDGDNMYISVQNQAILIKDGYFYSIDMQTKTAYRVKEDSPLATIKLSGAPDIAVQSLLDSGKEEFANKEYHYDQYGDCKIYTDNGKLAYFVRGEDKHKVEEFTPKANKSKLEFPKDYTYQEIEM